MTKKSSKVRPNRRGRKSASVEEKLGRIMDAVERIQQGRCQNPINIKLGKKLRITRESVSREARMSKSELYRIPEIDNFLNSLKSVPVEVQDTTNVGELERIIRQQDAFIDDLVTMIEYLAGSVHSRPNSVTEVLERGGPSKAPIRSS